jgi:prepilin-type N-terminal cleavage/methylation domain-containing protein
MITQPRGAQRRPAFTIVEILVVIAIIAVLAGLSSVAVLRWLDTSRKNNTEKTMIKVKAVLDHQVKDVLKQADEETIPAAVVILAGSDMPRARVIWRKLRLRQEFPMTLAEATQHPGTLVPSLAGVAELAPKYTSVPKINNLKPGAASSALLLLSLKKARGGKTLKDDDLANHLLDTDNDGFQEIVDAWGNPLQFYRTPTDNAALDAADPAVANTKSDKARDPGDPDGTLLIANWYNTPQRTQFETLCHKIKPATAKGGGQFSTYIVPVLVSPGRDGVLGLDTKTMAISPAANTNVNDNIFSYNLRG